MGRNNGNSNWKPRKPGYNSSRRNVRSGKSERDEKKREVGELSTLVDEARQFKEKLYSAYIVVRRNNFDNNFKSNEDRNHAPISGNANLSRVSLIRIWGCYVDELRIHGMYVDYLESRHETDRVQRQGAEQLAARRLEEINSYRDALNLPAENPDSEWGSAEGGDPRESA